MKRAAAAFALLALASCEPRATPKSPTEAGSAGDIVLRVDDFAIRAAEVDAESPAFALLEPRASDAQLRRLALTQVILPRVLARKLAGAEREAARARADAALRALRDGTWIGPLEPGTSGGRVAEGGFTELTIPIWSRAFALEPDGWSEVFENIGAFVIAKRLERRDGRVPAETWFKLELLLFPFLDEATANHDIEDAYDHAKLVFVDDRWREYVPERTQYRMGVHE